MKFKIAITTLICSLITGCGIVGQPFLWHDAKRVQIGMSLTQVIEIIGCGPTHIIREHDGSASYVWEHIEYTPWNAEKRYVAFALNEYFRVVKVPELSGEQFQDKLFGMF